MAAHDLHPEFRDADSTSPLASAQTLQGLQSRLSSSIIYVYILYIYITIYIYNIYIYLYPGVPNWLLV